MYPFLFKVVEFMAGDVKPSENVCSLHLFSNTGLRRRSETERNEATTGSSCKATPVPSATVRTRRLFFYGSLEGKNLMKSLGGKV